MKNEVFCRRTPNGYVEEGMRWTAETEEERWTLQRVGLGVYPTTDPMVFEQFTLGPFDRTRPLSSEDRAPDS